MITLLTQFIRRSPVIAFIKSLDGRYQVISDAWLRTFHTTEAEVVGRTDLELFGVEGSRSFVETDRQVLESGQPVERLDPMHVDGATHTYLSTKFLLFDHDGTRTGVGGFAVDVTEQQRVLDALRASEQRARDLVDQGPLAYVVFDVETRRVVDANRNAEVLFHATRAQLLACDPWDLSPARQPDGTPSRDGGRRFFERLAEGTQSFDWTHRTLDGEPLPTRVWFSREDRHTRHQVRLAILDLREIERANLELSRHRRFLEQTQAMAHVGGWELDLAQKRVVWTNETAHIFGRDPAQPTPSFEESNALYAPEHREAVHAVVTRAMTDGTPFRIEPEIITPAGRRRRVRISAVAELREGQPQRVFGAIQDVTEERLLEEQLRHASQMDAVGQLAAGVAHDFNNMLGAIVAAGEALKLDRLSPLSTESVDTILSAANQAASLTRQLLLFSRKERPRREPADLHAIVSDATGMLQRTLERRIIVDTRLEATHTRLSADASQLTNALVNLAVNARDAMPSGGRLTFRTCDDGPAHVRLEVIDTGVGIAPEVLPHLFEPFFTTKDRGRGTGLGLAAVFSAVKEHGGTITVRSAPGAGATFTLTLPVVDDAEGLAAPTSSLAMTWPGRTVLLVDDEDLVRRSMRRLLSRLGFTVLEAPDGARALELFGRTTPRPSLVVLDVMMPGLPALEVMKSLRADTPELPVVFCSGYAPDAVLQALGAQPHAARLSKPFSMESLREVIESVLPVAQRNWPSSSTPTTVTRK